MTTQTVFLKVSTSFSESELDTYLNEDIDKEILWRDSRNSEISLKVWHHTD